MVSFDHSRAAAAAAARPDAAAAAARRRRSRTRLALLIGLAAVGVLLSLGLYRSDEASYEAMVDEAVCRQLMQNTTVGRQALVGSAWWPPLPFLLRLPLMALIPPQVVPVSSLFVSALFGVGALFLLARVLKDQGVGWQRFVLAAALAADPGFRQACTDGSSGTTIVFLVILTAFGLAQWVARRKVRYLIALGLGAALLSVTSVELAGWLLALLLLVLLDLTLCGFGRGQKEAALILLILPAAYVIGLWVLMNWLIMGDGLYFLRSLSSAEWQRQRMVAGGVVFTDAHLCAAGVSLFVVLFALFGRDRSTAWLGLAGMTPLTLALVLTSRSALWQTSSILLCLCPLSILAVGGMISNIRRERPGIRLLAALVPLAVVVAAAVPRQVAAAGPAGPSSTQGWRTLESRRGMWLPRLEAHVLSRSPYSKIFVCGYESFVLLDSRGSGALMHALDFNFDKVKDDYHGQDLYVLVHVPTGRSAMDSVHWKFDRIYELGSRDTLYDGDWGEWRLFEIIQPPD